MPKIRDLGINVIPATMRPVEMGQGGGGCGDASACDPTEHPPCHPTEYDDDIEDDDKDKDKDKDKGDYEEPCMPEPTFECSADDKDKKVLGGLTTDQADQLRQQLQQQTGDALTT